MAKKVKNEIVDAKIELPTEKESAIEKDIIEADVEVDIKKINDEAFINPPIDEDLVVVAKAKIPMVDKSNVRVKFLKDFPDQYIICGRVSGKKGEVKMINREQLNILRKRNIVA